MLWVLTHRWQQDHSPGVHKQTGSEHGEVLSEAVGCVERAPLQRVEAPAAPPPLLHAVELAQRAEHTHRHTHRTPVLQGRGQTDGERLVSPIQTVMKGGKIK